MAILYILIPERIPCFHLDKKYCGKAEFVKIKGIKKEASVVAYKLPKGAKIYAPVDGVLKTFSDPFFVIEGKKFPGVILYKLDKKGRVEYAINFIFYNDTKTQKSSKVVKKGKEIGRVLGKVYGNYNLLAYVSVFDKDLKIFKISKELTKKVLVPKKNK